jgi:hypothetical protein
MDIPRWDPAKRGKTPSTVISARYACKRTELIRETQKKAGLRASMSLSGSAVVQKR